MNKLVFDTETQGLPNFKLPADDPSQPRMCSLAAVLIDDAFEPVKQMYRLIKPDGWVVGEDTAKIHGLTTERLEAEGIPIDTALDEWLAMHDDASELFAFGIEFDLKIIRGELRRASREDRYGERPKTCMMRLCTPLCKIPPTEKMMASGRKWFKTPSLAEAHQILLGEPMEGAHNALADVMATIRIMRHLNKQKETNDNG